MNQNNLSVTAIKYHQKQRTLEVSFNDGTNTTLTAEFLRVHSPSAEVTGHHPSQAILVTNKMDVQISNIQAVGNYAVKIHFSDGHDTGLYSWQYLYQLSQEQQSLWQHYLQRLKAAKAHRDAIIPIKIQNYS